MNLNQSSRRRFLKNGAALAGLAVGAIRSASGQAPGSESPEARPKDLHAYGERSRFETPVREPAEGRAWSRYMAAQETPVQDSMGIITPNSLHFIASHGNEPPDIDPREHRLMIHGMVDRPLIFTLEDLKRLPSVTRIHFVECAGNSSPLHYRMKKTPMSIQSVHGETSCSVWTGVPLALLLKEAGLKNGASWLIAEGADTIRHAKSIPLEKAMDDVLVVYGQNGEAVRPEQGYPLRLLVPGFEGVSNVKWLRRIKLVDQPYMTQPESVGYSNLKSDGKARWFQFEVGVKSVITYPSDAHRLTSRGFYQISGLAWSARGAIKTVEVSTDGGRTWKQAELQEPVYRKAHTRFGLGWNWNGEEAVLQSRCTDEHGEVQPTLAELSKIWGVETDYWMASTLPPVRTFFTHFSAVQPWKVNRDGSIQNAMFT
jgi:sulfane dehydrogenase subunit SoxC